MIDHFLDYLRTEKQYSKLTIRAYKDDICQFLLFYGLSDSALFDPRSVKHHDVRSWIMSMSSRQMKATTINRRVSALRSFYRFLMRKEIVSENPCDKITSLRKQRHLPSFVSSQQMERFLDSLLNPVDDYLHLRESTIVLMFYATGVRLAELVHIQLSDLSLSEREVRVTGKGNKQRIVPLPEQILPVLNRYLFFREKICNYQSNYLFLAKNFNCISRSDVCRIVGKVLAYMGVEGKKSPHVLRHTFATHLLNAGAGIESVKELLGHETLSTTQIYTHTSITELLKCYQNNHPRVEDKNKK